MRSDGLICDNNKHAPITLTIPNRPLVFDQCKRCLYPFRR